MRKDANTFKLSRTPMLYSFMLTSVSLDPLTPVICFMLTSVNLNPQTHGSKEIHMMPNPPFFDHYAC